MVGPLSALHSFAHGCCRYSLPYDPVKAGWGGNCHHTMFAYVVYIISACEWSLAVVAPKKVTLVCGTCSLVCNAGNMLAPIA